MTFGTNDSVTVRDLCTENVGPAIGNAPGTRTSRQACTLEVKTRLLWVIVDVHQRQIAAQLHYLQAQA